MKASEYTHGELLVCDPESCKRPYDARSYDAGLARGRKEKCMKKIDVTLCPFRWQFRAFNFGGSGGSGTMFQWLGLSVNFYYL